MTILGLGLDGPLGDDNRLPANGCARELSAGDPERQLHKAGPAHLKALFDPDLVLAVLISAVLSEIAREGRRRRARGWIFDHAERGREHPGVEVIALLCRLATENKCRGMIEPVERRIKRRKVDATAPHRIEPAHRKEREWI